jgi:hypothetical protein
MYALRLYDSSPAAFWFESRSLCTKIARTSFTLWVRYIQFPAQRVRRSKHRHRTAPHRSLRTQAPPSASRYERSLVVLKAPSLLPRLSSDTTDLTRQGSPICMQALRSGLMIGEEPGTADGGSARAMQRGSRKETSRCEGSECEPGWAGAGTGDGGGEAPGDAAGGDGGREERHAATSTAARRNS